jgi:hypothetical protein
LEQYKKTASITGSNKKRIVAWIILSFWELIPRGLLPPSDLGIQTFLIGVALKLCDFSSSESLPNLLRLKLTLTSPSNPACLRRI